MAFIAQSENEQKKKGVSAINIYLGAFPFLFYDYKVNLKSLTFHSFKFKQFLCFLSILSAIDHISTHLWSCGLNNDFRHCNNQISRTLAFRLWFLNGAITRWVYKHVTSEFLIHNLFFTLNAVSPLHRLPKRLIAWLSCQHSDHLHW